MWCSEWRLITRAENVSDILSNTQEDMKQKRRIETIRCGAPCSLRWSGVVHLAALTIQQEGAGGRSPSYLEFKWRKWQRMSPWNFSHQECYTLLFTLSPGLRTWSWYLVTPTVLMLCDRQSQVYRWYVTSQFLQHQRSPGGPGTRDNGGWYWNHDLVCSSVLSTIFWFVKLNLLIKPWLIVDLHHPRAMSR